MSDDPGRTGYEPRMVACDGDEDLLEKARGRWTKHSLLAYHSSLTSDLASGLTLASSSHFSVSPWLQFDRALVQQYSL